jgi:transcriptional regulator with XRE-family HTH domain
MGHPRPRPKRLAEKLLKIRQTLGVSQSAMVYRLGVELAPNNISKYEHDLNEPSTDVILAYARLARVPLEQLVDDEMDLTLHQRSSASDTR